MLRLVVFVLCLFIDLGLGEIDLTILDHRFIVGGKKAPHGALPYQASIRNKYNWNLCGGTILNNRWVLTAAHCNVGRSPSDIKIVVGTNNLISGGDSYSVESIAIHEGYTDVYNGSDISLIKVSTDIKFSDLVQPIQLPTENIGAGVDVLASGWGWISVLKLEKYNIHLTKNGTRTTDLHMIELKALSVEQCQRELNGKHSIYDSQICTLTKPGEGTCRGDSGGPLVGAKSVVGVISWGEPCAIGFPDVYTRVFAFKDWIQEKMSN